MTMKMMMMMMMMMMMSNDVMTMMVVMMIIIKIMIIMISEVPWDLPPTLKWWPSYWWPGKADGWCGPQDYYYYYYIDVIVPSIIAMSIHIIIKPTIDVYM